MQTLPLAILGYLGDHSPPLLAGFIGGILSQVVVWLLSRGKSDMPAQIRRQIILLWVVVILLLILTIEQGANIRHLLEAG